MRRSSPPLPGWFAVAAVTAAMLVATALAAQSTMFHNAPASVSTMKNPYSGDAAAGKKLYNQNCAQCHGNNLQGIGPAPALLSTSVKNAKSGELFWFITNGDLNKGMPSWSQLPKQQRWQIVAFLESRNAAK